MWFPWTYKALTPFQGLYYWSHSSAPLWNPPCWMIQDHTNLSLLWSSVILVWTSLFTVLSNYSLIFPSIHHLPLQLNFKPSMLANYVGAHYMNIITHLLIDQINRNTSSRKTHLSCFSSMKIILSQKSFFILEHSTEIFHMDYFPQENCIVLKTPKSLL